MEEEAEGTRTGGMRSVCLIEVRSNGVMYCGSLATQFKENGPSKIERYFEVKVKNVPMKPLCLKVSDYLAGVWRRVELM